MFEFSYTIEIRSKVNKAEDIPEMWSKATNISFWSGSRIPDQPPQTAAGSFYVDDNHHVYIYWKELDEFKQNGAGFGYQLECTSHKHIPTNKPSNNSFFQKYTSLRENVREDIHFTVRSINEMGPSEQSSVIRVPSKANLCDLPRDIRSILHNKGPKRKYVFSWSPPAKNSHIITSYTVFWCKAGIESPSICNVS